MFQVQFGYDPETDVILTLIQQMFQVQFRYDLEMDVILTLIKYMFKYNHDIDPSTKSPHVLFPAWYRGQRQLEAKSLSHTHLGYLHSP